MPISADYITKNQIAELYQIFGSFQKMKEAYPADAKLHALLDELIKLRAEVENLKALQTSQTPDE